MTTTIIGLDGADWQIIDPMLTRGELPVLQTLIDNGCRGILHSTVPPSSPPAWASMITGVNPGKHNIYDFSYIDTLYRKQPIDAMSRISAPPLWRIMNQAGLSIGMVNLPIHYPPETVNGFIVCGLVTPSSARTFTYPPELGSEIGNAGEQWIIGQTLARGGSPREFLKEITEKTRRQADWILRLQKKYQPDFLMVVFDGTDKIQHFFWKYWDDTHPRHDLKASAFLKDAIPSYYRFVDACIGEVINARPDNDILIVSDHGFTGISQDVFIEEWLIQQGYLHLKSAPSAALNPKLENSKRFAWNALARIRTLKSFLKGNRLTSRFIEKLKGRVLQGNTSSLNQNVDWSQTRVFFNGVSSQSLQINLQGREGEGIVSPENRSSIIREVIASLLQIRDPLNDRPVIRAAFAKEELYNGPCVNNAPDMTIITEKGYTLQEGFPHVLVRPSILHGMDRSGDHRSEGIFIASGPNIQKQEGHLEAQINDITPTVLYLNGLPIPDYMDGSVCTEWIRNSYLQGQPVEQTHDILPHHSQLEELTTEERKLLENHLRALGYF